MTSKELKCSFGNEFYTSVIVVPQEVESESANKNSLKKL